MKNKRIGKYFTVGAILIASILIINFIYKFTTISPLNWKPQLMPKMEGKLAENNFLQSSKEIPLDEYFGPEDIAVNSKGELYTGIRNKINDFETGKIIKISKNNEIKTIIETDGWVAGIHFDKDENLIACHLNKGLVSINPSGKMDILAQKDDFGNSLSVPNDVDIASDGIIYFSNTTSRSNFTLDEALKIVLEQKPEGSLLKYDPTTKKVNTLISGLYFANGVAVSKDDDFILVAETSRYRILKFWLKGNKKGQTEIFMDNLPGFPNGISRRKDGTFWIGFSTCRNAEIDKIQSDSFMKKILWALPKLVRPKIKAYGLIMNVNDNGNVLKIYCDPSGKFVSEASSVEEYNGYVYLGGDILNHINKFKLD